MGHLRLRILTTGLSHSVHPRSPGHDFSSEGLLRLEHQSGPSRGHFLLFHKYQWCILGSALGSTVVTV